MPLLGILKLKTPTICGIFDISIESQWYSPVFLLINTVVFSLLK